jgi:hypothetical protein
MGCSLLHAEDAFWRPSNQMGVQIVNDTDHDVLWLAVGAPVEAANTLEMTPERLARLDPDGPRALPPELAGR